MPLINTKFSYEFFPPRCESAIPKLWRAIGLLERLEPAFFSITYGALGSAQSVSVDTALQMQGESSVATAAHLTCAGQSRQEIDAIIQQFKQAGIKHIVALRGDDNVASLNASTSTYTDAVALVQRLTELGGFEVSVAAYPETHPMAQNPAQDLDNLKAKFDAGADRAISQFFFDADIYLRFRDKAIKAGITKPLVPGILPIRNIERVIDLSKRCGTFVPKNVIDQFGKVKGQADASYQQSVAQAVSVCEKLQSEGVDQFHFYTLNQADLCFEISLALGAQLKISKVSDQIKAA